MDDEHSTAIKGKNGRFVIKLMQSAVKIVISVLYLEFEIDQYITCFVSDKKT